MPCCLHPLDSREFLFIYLFFRKHEPAMMVANNRTSITKKLFHMKNANPLGKNWIMLSITQSFAYFQIQTTISDFDYKHVFISYCQPKFFIFQPNKITELCQTFFCLFPNKPNKNSTKNVTWRKPLSWCDVDHNNKSVSAPWRGHALDGALGQINKYKWV